MSNDVTTIEDVSPVPIKKKRGSDKSPVIGDNGFLIKDEMKRQLISKLLNETLTTYSMPKVKNDEELAERIGWYYQHCAETGQKPTVEQLAQSTGYSIQTIWDWENGVNKGFTSATSEIIKKAKDFLRVFDAKLVIDGALNPVTYIFRAKNYYGMKDVQDFNIAPSNPLGDLQDPKDITKKYLESVPE